MREDLACFFVVKVGRGIGYAPIAVTSQSEIF
jgi:hypothetical protein